jgi:hypothetical protein
MVVKYENDLRETLSRKLCQDSSYNSHLWTWEQNFRFHKNREYLNPMDLDLAGGEGPSSPNTPRPHRQALCVRLIVISSVIHL